MRPDVEERKAALGSRQVMALNNIRSQNKLLHAQGYSSSKNSKGKLCELVDQSELLIFLGAKVAVTPPFFLEIFDTIQQKYQCRAITLSREYILIER